MDAGGDVRTNTAAVRLNHCLWHLEWLARGLPTREQGGWDQAYAEFRQARQRFLELARVGLGVRGTRVAESVPWPPPWKNDLSQTAHGGPRRVRAGRGLSRRRAVPAPDRCRRAAAARAP
ncbi:hypothetical protein GCM10020295_47910 [Streptomyces cinereospinus]